MSFVLVTFIKSKGISSYYDIMQPGAGHRATMGEADSRVSNFRMLDLLAKANFGISAGGGADEAGVRHECGIGIGIVHKIDDEHCSGSTAEATSRG